MDCSKITMTSLVAANCDAAAIAGTFSKIALFNYSDIDKAGSSLTGNVITNVLMNGATKGMYFESLEDSHVGEVSLAAGTYFSEFDHAVTLRIFAKTEAAKTFLNELKNGRVVVFLPNKAQGANGEVKWEVYGWDSGLKLTELTNTTEFADRVVYTLKLASTENSKEQSLPKTFFDTDLTATETLFTSLIAAY